MTSARRVLCTHASQLSHRPRSLWQGLSTDDLFRFVFDSLLDATAAKQIKRCAPTLKEQFDASTDKRRTQRAILEALVGLVTSPKHGEAMLKKTSTILMALYADGPLPSPTAGPRPPPRPPPRPMRGDPTGAACYCVWP